MLISILIPIYKVEKYIERCLDSIFNQTYSEIEYVFVDDCSPDNSFNILKDYIQIHNVEERNKVTIISHSENKGISITRNNLLDNAKGEYVLFVDSDDWIEYNMVEQMAQASNNGIIDIISCDFTKEYANGKQILQYENYANDCKENMVRLINYNIGTILWKMLIRRNLFKKIRFQPNIEIGEDYIASIKLYYYANNCTYIHQFLYHYCQFNTNRYSNQISKSISDHIKAVTAVEKFLKDEGVYNDRIDKEIKLRKFCIKSYYLSSQLLDYKKWNNTFPESNKMWRYIKYTKKEKIKFWLAEKHIFWILQFLKH